MQRAGSAAGVDAERVASRLTGAEFVSLRCRADGDALAATGLLARTLAAIDTPFQAAVRRPGHVREPATEADLVLNVGLTDPSTATGDAGRGGSDDTDDGDGGDAGADDDGNRVDDGDDSGIDRSDGTNGAVSLPGDRTSASLTAARLARQAGSDPDPLLALAGGVAAAIRDARDPFGDGDADHRDAGGNGEKEAENTDDKRNAADLAALRDRVRTAGLLDDRRPGIAAPTADPVDGFVHTTLAHTDVSGDIEATRERCGTLADRGDDRELASLLACSVVDAEGASPRAATAVERALRPTPASDSATPVRTLGGYADVLGALAADRPGIGLALVCGYDVRDAALSAWRTHARRAHTALRTATIARYDGLCVARLADEFEEAIDAESTADAERTADAGRTDRGEGTGRSDTDGDGRGDDNGDADSGVGNGARPPVATVARLCRDFRSPEPVALAVGNGAGAVAATEDRALGTVVARAARDCDGTGGGSERAAEAGFGGTNDEFVAAVRAALADGTPNGRASGTDPAGAREPGDGRTDGGWTDGGRTGGGRS